MEYAEPMYKNWASDESVVKYLTWPAHSSIEVSKSVIKDWVENYLGIEIVIKGYTSLVISI